MISINTCLLQNKFVIFCVQDIKNDTVDKLIIYEINTYRVIKWKWG